MEASKEELEALLARACPVCEGAIPRRKGEPPWQHARRQFCSRSCGAKATNARVHTATPAEILGANSASTDGGCLEWTGRTNVHGYGVAVYGGEKLGAHRLAYTAHVGPIPDGLSVCHTCDNRRCVNPAHLFLGTNAENTADRDRKGRQARGEQSGRAKLTESDVRAIRASAEPHAVLAKRFGVGATIISSIRTGKAWRHVE